MLFLAFKIINSSTKNVELIMKRNLLSRTSKILLLLGGVGVGLFSLASSTDAQTTNGLPPIVAPGEFCPPARTPNSMSLIELAPTVEVDDPTSIPVPVQTESTTVNLVNNETSATGLAENLIRTPMNVMSATDSLFWQKNRPASAGENSAVDDSSQPQKFAEPKEIKNTSSIVVDSLAFEHYSPQQTKTEQTKTQQPVVEQPEAVLPVVREIEPPVTSKVPFTTTTPPRSSRLKRAVQTESIPETPFVPAPLSAIESESKTRFADQFSNMQVSASQEQLNRSSPSAIPTTIPTADTFVGTAKIATSAEQLDRLLTSAIRTPNSIVDPTINVASNRMLQPIDVAETASKPIDVSFN